MSLAITQGWSQHFGPGCFIDKTELVHDYAIQTHTAQAVEVVGATQANGAAIDQFNGEIAFIYFLDPAQIVQSVLEWLPNGLFALAICGTDIPDLAIGLR